MKAKSFSSNRSAFNGRAVESKTFNRRQLREEMTDGHVQVQKRKLGATILSLGVIL